MRLKRRFIILTWSRTRTCAETARNAGNRSSTAPARFDLSGGGQSKDVLTYDMRAEGGSVSTAHSQSAPLRVEACDIERASSLVRALVAVFDAEVVSLDGESLEVHIGTRDDSSTTVSRVLDAVEAWLVAEGLDSAVVHLGHRSFRAKAPAVAPWVAGGSG
jgi:hypothetical protein